MHPAASRPLHSPIHVSAAATRAPARSSTIIGDTIARTLEFSGADVLRLNHIVRRRRQRGAASVAPRRRGRGRRRARGSRSPPAQLLRLATEAVPR